MTLAISCNRPLRIFLESFVLNTCFSTLNCSMPKAAVAVKKKKKVNGYEFPDPLPAGEVLKDVRKKEWCLGISIGKGGFGEIYAACEAGTKSKIYPYAIKIEPHANGPLFVERSFYVKVCKPEKLEEWKTNKGIKMLGVPCLHGFGSHIYDNKNYRFVVMDRFGKDLWSLFLENKKVLPAQSVFNYTLQILDAIEYIHSTGYVHADIKGANLLFGFTKGSENNLFLIDFGLACKFTSDKDFKRDPRKAHDGTIEYTSRDFHQGVPTRRGDLEILGYNILHWLNSSLPWEKHLTNPEKVHESKNDFMSSVKKKLAVIAPDIPTVVADYLEYTTTLGHLEEPNYDRCRDMFKKALSKLPKAGKVATPKITKGRRKASKSPKKRTRAGTSKESKENFNDTNEDIFDQENKETDEEKDDDEEILSPTKRHKANTPQKKLTPKWKKAPLCEPGKISTSRSTKTQPKTKPETDDEITTQSSAPKSWRDCPTMKASNVQIAGQYTKRTLDKKVKAKKK